MSRILRLTRPIRGRCLRPSRLFNNGYCLPQRRIVPLYPRMTLALQVGLTVGLGLGFGINWVMAQPKSMPDLEHVFKGEKLHGGQVKQLNNDMCSIVRSTKNIQKDLDQITNLFLEKCDLGPDTMSANQFWRWLRFYTRTDLKNTKKLWEAAFQIDSLLTVAELRVGYTFLRSMMSKKTAKERSSKME